jgi:predicted homoserine dehydrogenase-like protein
VIAEATGEPEMGAKFAYEAIKHGKHVAMINKEADSAVGPILKHYADKAGLVYTAVDGDQQCRRTSLAGFMSAPRLPAADHDDRRECT